MPETACQDLGADTKDDCDTVGTPDTEASRSPEVAAPHPLGPSGSKLDSRWLVYALLVAAVAPLYWASIASLWARWRPDPSYSHGWLIFAISGWMIWREARAGRLDSGRPSWLGVAAVPAAGLAWLLAMAGSIGVVQWLLLPALMFALAFALFGWTTVHRLWFPFAFTMFAIPIWDGISPALQAITVRVVGIALMALRIPALLVGNRVELPAGAFQIVEGCSGTHFFLVSATLACLYGWLWYRRLGRTLVLLAIALAVAMVANWLRVFLVIYAGHLTDMQHFLVQVDHYYFGWALFMVMMAPVFVLARRLETAQFTPVVPAGPAAAGGSHDPGLVDLGAPRKVPARWRVFAASALAGLAAAPLAWLLLSQTTVPPPPDALPAGRAGWELLGKARPDWEPNYRGADAVLGGGYWRNGQGVDAWIVYYERPSQGRELANTSNRLAARRDGRLVLDGREARLSAAGGQRLIWYSHIIGGRESTGTMTAKLHQILGTLSGQPNAALLAVSAICDADCDAARDLLEAFEADMGSVLRSAIAGRGEHHGHRMD